MKRQITIGRMVLAALATILGAIAILGCDGRQNGYEPPRDFEAPPVPTGVTTTTMDGEILVSWDPIYLDPDYDDLAGFKVYRSINNNLFSHIATVDRDVYEYLDTGLENGSTYYWAVTSFDTHGNESDLSYETVFDTPRPEGFDERIYNYLGPAYEQLSGFDFSLERVISWNSPSCDIFLEYDDSPGIQAFYIWLGDNGADIQDMGYTDSFDDITYAPNAGWSQFSYVEAILGHTYVLRTMDNHYAKVRVTGFSGSPDYSMVFDWGYQIDAGNRELKMEPPATGPLAGNNGVAE